MLLTWQKKKSLPDLNYIVFLLFFLVCLPTTISTRAWAFPWPPPSHNKSTESHNYEKGTLKAKSLCVDGWGCAKTWRLKYQGSFWLKTQLLRLSLTHPLPITGPITTPNSSTDATAHAAFYVTDHRIIKGTWCWLVHVGSVHDLIKFIFLIQGYILLRGVRRKIELDLVFVLRLMILFNVWLTYMGIN